MRAFTIVSFAAPGIPVPFVAASSTATARACAATSSTSSPTPSTCTLGMKVRLATYPVGTDDEGTEAIGFGFEPPDAGS